MRSHKSHRLYSRRMLLMSAVAIGGVLAAMAVHAQRPARFCSATANDQFLSCQEEAADDYFKTRAICTNISDNDAREDCNEQAAAERRDGRELCGEQRSARKDLCALLGEGRYDPAFDPADYDTDFNNPPNLNPYRPVVIGHEWQYVGGDQTIDIEVRNETKLIEGVTCVVVNDRVEVGGELVEDTNDWLAQAKNGDVWYCGEEVKDYDSFDGDNPQLPELVSIDGSFKAGRDGDKAGTLFLGTPVPSAVYRQEFSASNAEDAVMVLSTSYGYGSDPALDQFVPQELATIMCANNDCVVTSDFTPIDPAPEAVERKYYANGIGLFFSVHEITGKGVQIVGCNFDPRCATLPTP